jgi:hypothetical protein
MKHMACLVALAALALSRETLALGDLAQVTLIDRETGATLIPRFYRGEYWVAGTPGARYGIEIHNRLGERLLAVVSVDGVNVLSGTTASWDQVGYVFGPRQGYQVTGWRKSDEQVAAFTFTQSPHSYAERTGRPANVGVIGVALFREQPVVQIEAPQLSAPPPGEGGPTARAAPPPPPSAPSSAAPAPERLTGEDARKASPPDTAQAPDSQALGGSSRRAVSPPLARAEPKLGTGHGERETSYVTHTAFVRMQDEPNEIIRIHYDSLNNLIALGIIRRPDPLARPPDPFPASRSSQYVPDPPAELP